MAVDSTTTVALHPFREDIARVLGVDGYFYAQVTSTGDASGGYHFVRFEEPSDSLLSTRCLLIQDYSIETSYDNGNVRIIGKLGGSLQEDRLMIPLANQELVDAFNVMYVTGGGDLSSAVRNRGWWVPSFAPGSQRLIVEVRFTNANLVQVDARIYGYYLTVRSV